MATRSFIGMSIKPGEVIYQYCHSDGDIPGNGKILYEEYNDFHSIYEILKIEKPIRSFGKDGTINYFDEFHPLNGCSLSDYGPNSNNLNSPDTSDIEYFYYYDLFKNEWFVKGRNDKDFVLLSQVLVDNGPVITSENEWLLAT